MGDFAGTQKQSSIASAHRVPVGTWFDPATGATVDNAIAWLARHSVVLLGETNDDAEHHRWQLHTIAGLHALRPDLALGFEMFPRRVQPVPTQNSERRRNSRISLAFGVLSRDTHPAPDFPAASMV